jgi:molybdopterin synthase catalytic subunit
MDLQRLLEKVKRHPDFSKAGMVLCHKGVVRGFSRDGRKVSGIRIAVDSGKLALLVSEKKRLSGIVEILVEIDDQNVLNVGDDIMHLVVAGDVRENVIDVLSATLDEIKNTVTRKTEFFV